MNAVVSLDCPCVYHLFWNCRPVVEPSFMVRRNEDLSVVAYL